MPLKSGDRLGPFEIIASLGVGGMGEVYLAHDVRLGRQVAIKILSQDISRSPDFRARFEREARTLSQLHHANICALYDVGREGATDFLVMEFLEGQTLATRLAEGPLPLDEALWIAGQIADALAHAHKAGFIHRDLKPGNVMLVPGEAPRRPVVKLLDFGLAGHARAQTPAAPGELTVPADGPLTVEGSVLGTLPYMAPEQVEGKTVDTRADIWAFGCVLYELLAGRRAFGGDTQPALIGSILERQPAPILDRAPNTPRGLVRLVEACLAKDSSRRLQSAHDARLALDWVIDEGQKTTPRDVRPPGPRKVLLSAAAGLVAGAAAMAAWFAGSARTVPTDAVPVSAAIALPPGGSFSPFGSTVALSPDGNLLVYSGNDNGTARLFLRALDSFEARPLPGTEGGETPFFSPDGTQVGFQAGGQLKRIALAGGAPSKIVDVRSARGAVWLHDDTIVYTPSFNDALWRVPVSGDGTPAPVTTLDAARNERTHRFPTVLPGGRTVLYMAGDTSLESFGDARVMAQSVDGGTPRLILQGGVAPQYLRSGFLTYYTGRALMAVPFDPVRLEPTGQAVVIAEHVAWSKGFGTAHYAVGGDGTIVYVPGDETWPAKSVEWLTRGGARARIEPLDGYFMAVRADRRGGRLLLLEHATNDTLRLYDLGREALSRLTFTGSYNQAAWLPSGTHIVTVRGSTVVRVAVDANAVEHLYEDETQKTFIDASPDGRRILFDAVRGSGSDLMMFDVEKRVAHPWQAERFIETQPRFSPDGRWVAYVSDESGRFEIFIRAADGTGGRIQISNRGGTSPVWSHNGQEIFFAAPSIAPDNPAPPGDLHVVELSGAGPGAPRLVVRDAWPRPTWVATLGIPTYSYDALPDGRFVVIQSAPPPVPAQINLIVRGGEK